ncbi:Immunoglobulin lambda variable 5-45 [Camelus dromedarius]|nr:Immunoglobulin lambda variable 5-45 [Camelus dromedarius]
MAWSPLLLTLLAHCTGLDSQTVVTQKPSLSVSPGGTVTLTCGLSSGCFSGSISGNKTALTITGAQPEDEADYYCAVYKGEDKRGQGSPASAHGLSRTVSTMAGISALLVLLSLCAGSLSQPVLTQPPSLSASPGDSARLTCTLSSGTVVGGYHINWFQKKAGSPPRYLLRFYSDSNKHQGSGVPSRFSGSKDASANAGLLLISGLQPEDEADYYCGTYHGNTGTHTVPQPHRDVRLKPPLCSPSCAVTAALPGTRSDSG